MGALGCIVLLRPSNPHKYAERLFLIGQQVRAVSYCVTLVGIRVGIKSLLGTASPTTTRWGFLDSRGRVHPKPPAARPTFPRRAGQRWCPADELAAIYGKGWLGLARAEVVRP